MSQFVQRIKDLFYSVQKLIKKIYVEDSIVDSMHKKNLE